jgi:thiol:disulfide interchange protein DsbA
MQLMIKRTILVLAALVALAGGHALAQDGKPVPYQEGLHYFLIDSAPVKSAGDRIELVEAFSYLCTHCNTFEPYINNWKDRRPAYVDFRRIPVVFGRGSWELYARGFVTAQFMNAPEEAHMAMMDELWKEKNIMRSMDEIAEFYTRFGLDADKFKSTAQSFAVDSRIRKDQLEVAAYGIQGTPSLVLNGKYRISGNAAVPSFEVMLDVVDYLIEREVAEMNLATANSGGASAGQEGG